MSEWKEQSEDENDFAAKVHPFQPPLDWRDFWTILNGWREWLFIFLICVRSEDRLTTICNLVEAFKETTEHNCITENCRGWKKLDYKSKEGHCNAQPQLLTLFQSLSNKTTKQNHQYHHVHHHHQPDPSCLVVHHWQRPLHRQSSLNFKNESDRKLWKNDRKWRKMRSDYPVLIRWDSMRDWMLEHLLLRIYLTTVLWTTTTKPLLLRLEDNNLSSEKWKKRSKKKTKSIWGDEIF